MDRRQFLAAGAAAPLVFAAADDPKTDDRTSASITVTRSGSTLTFDFGASTWDGIFFSGQMACAEAV